jgi:hypothetical protein
MLILDARCWMQNAGYWLLLPVRRLLSFLIFSPYSRISTEPNSSTSTLDNYLTSYLIRPPQWMAASYSVVI